MIGERKLPKYPSKFQVTIILCEEFHESESWSHAIERSSGKLGLLQGFAGLFGLGPFFYSEGALAVPTPGTSLWFIGYVKEGVSYDYDGPGLNHLAFSVSQQSDVDAAQPT